MSKRKLLLADDSITIQKVVNLTFADEGIEVISVGDGNSAMDKLREDAPDLVLADVNMPGLNGYEICEKIKDTNKDTPVILLVGSFEPFDEDEAKRVGADDYLTKPFQSISQLVNKVNILLNPEQGQEESTENELTAESETPENMYPEAENEAFSENETFGGLADASIDDEMIQTDQIGSLPIDEVPKFETPLVDTEVEKGFELKEDSPDTFGISEETYHLGESHQQNSLGAETGETAGGFENSYLNQPLENSEPEVDFNATQSYNYEEREEFNFDEEPTPQDFIHTEEIEISDPSKANGDSDFLSDQVDSESFEADDTDFEVEEPAPVYEDSVDNTSAEISDFSPPEETVSLETGQTGEVNGREADLPLPEAASVLELDEMNLLELPPLDIPAKAGTSKTEKISESGETLDSEPETGSEAFAGDQIEELAVETGPSETLETTPVTEEKSDETMPDEKPSGGEAEMVFEAEDSLSPSQTDDDKEMENHFKEPENGAEEGEETKTQSELAEGAEEVSAEPLTVASGVVEKSTEETAGEKILQTEEELLREMISTEMVEMITQRVVEKLSERAIKDIAWEVVPQMADLIIKKMAEEKMKD